MTKTAKFYIVLGLICLVLSIIALIQKDLNSANHLMLLVLIFTIKIDQERIGKEIKQLQESVILLNKIAINYIEEKYSKK